MSLKEVLAQKPSSPYHKLPPIRILVVEILEKPHVVSWNFNHDSVTAGVKKHNKQVSVTDGNSVTKFTIFEDITCKLKEGESYIIRGYNVWGQHPPYAIAILKQTIFFRAAAVTASEELINAAKNLLHPHSTATAVSDCQKVKGFLSVRGVVMEISAIKKIATGKGEIPLRTILLEQDKTQMTVTLWREAALFAVTLGEAITLTHLTHVSTEYGSRLQSSGFTKIEAQVTDTLQNVEVVGVVENTEMKGKLQILLDDDSVLDIDTELWEPFDQHLKTDKVVVTIDKVGSKVTMIRRVENQN